MNKPQQKWKPRGKKKKLLEVAQIPGLNRTLTALCKEAGVSRTSFYNWVEKDEDFRSAWNTVWELAIDKYMPSVVAAQVKEAQDGSTPAAKYLSELSGKMKREIDVNLGGDITVVIEEDE